MDPRRARRRTFLSGHIPPILEHEILEIGASDSPTFWPWEGHIRYLDVMSHDELLERYRDNPRRNPAHLVPVHYVTRGRPVDAVVDQPVDVVIANHVIEHVPDVLDWLHRLRRITVGGGHLFMAIPDRRYTFDYLRRVTDAIDLIEWHDRGASQADKFTQLRAIYYYRPVRAETAWNEGVQEIVQQPRLTLRQAAERVRAKVHGPTDTHCHIFTYESFIALWKELERNELVPWRLIEAVDVAEGGNEFLVLLSAVDRETVDLEL